VPDRAEGPPQPGRWVWQPDDGTDDWRRRLVDTLPHIDRIRELRNPALTPEQKAALYDEILAEIRQRHIEQLAAERARRPLWRDGHPPWERPHP
jgi:hypothetical protein